MLVAKFIWLNLFKNKRNIPKFNKNMDINNKLIMYMYGFISVMIISITGRNNTFNSFLMFSLFKMSKH